MAFHLSLPPRDPSDLSALASPLSQALERLLILHEDHEQNASTSTVRLVGSTQVLVTHHRTRREADV